MTLLLETALKISVIVLVGLTLTAMLRSRAAALRHWVLAVALGCATAAPLLALIIPSWQVSLGTAWLDGDREMPGRQVAQRITSLDAGEPQASGQVSEAFEPESGSVDARVQPRTVIIVTWMAGLGISLAILILGGVRLARLAARSRRIVDRTWTEIADSVARTYGLRRPVVLLESADPRLLVTWGMWRPKVMVPAGADRWTEDRIRLVLYHELAHIRRGDWIVQLAAEVLRSVYWFNPLVWIACARLRQESEQACDDAVLCCGVEGSEYATHLVEIARNLGPRRMWLPAQAIARTPSLERRVKAMLDDRLNRRPLSRSAGAATLVVLLAVTIPIAGVAAEQTTFGSLAGSIVDPTNGVLPGVTLVLTNVESRAKYELQSDRTGRYEFVGLPPGEYLLETRLPGFARFESRVTVAGRAVQQDVALQLGSLQETVSVVDGPTDRVVPIPEDPAKQRVTEEKRLQRAATRCPDRPSADPIRIGGNIRVPMKLRHVAPHYPTTLRGSGTEGTVVLQGRIGADGSMAYLDVVSSTHPDFASAATDAVRQWEFDPTLLNCVAVEVDMTVTVNFRYRQ